MHAHSAQRGLGIARDIGAQGLPLGNGNHCQNAHLPQRMIAARERTPCPVLAPFPRGMQLR